MLQLKTELLQALRQLVVFQNEPEVKELVKTLEKDNLNVPALGLLKIVFLLACKFPEVLNDPRNKLLQACCKKIVNDNPNVDFFKELDEMDADHPTPSKRSIPSRL